MLDNYHDFAAAAAKHLKMFLLVTDGGAK